MNNKKYIIIIFFILSSCQKHNIYFDIKSQRIFSCNNIPIKLLEVDNDSIKANGFPYEGGFLFVWEGDNELIPSDFSFNNVPKEYRCTKGGILYKSKIKLKPNCGYIVKKSGNGLNPDVIKIWTDKKGIVYKTTRSECIDNKGTSEELLK
ncbi:hypothetical protein ACFFLS_03605 [Flavobacterium procerum]|uniref:Lipoprotein n=1 Tax=Flavobacterium procerum TaxID=1455569 RepID=A0ABV6BNA7_9FLAO